MAKTVSPKGAAKRYKKRAAKGKKKYSTGAIIVSTPKKKHVLGVGVTKKGKRRTTAVFSTVSPKYRGVATVGKKEVLSSKRASKPIRRLKKKKK